MNKYTFKILTLGLFMTLFVAGNYSSHARADSSTNTLTHCSWGDIGCKNPPPDTAPRAATKSENKTSKQAQPVTPAKPALTGTPNIAKACNKDLSTPDECWTNCKTEDDITICDIIKLDTFMPEATAGGWIFSGQIKTKTYSGKSAKGRVMVRKK